MERKSYLLLGAMLVGIGVGILVGEVLAATLIGVGSGFLLWGICGSRRRGWSGRPKDTAERLLD